MLVDSSGLTSYQDQDTKTTLKKIFFTEVIKVKDQIFEVLTRNIFNWLVLCSITDRLQKH